jgi:uncharacterized protein (DUF3820 family)
LPFCRAFCENIMRMPFGKHKGEALEDLDLSYVKWLEEQDWVSDDLREAAQFEIERREGDRPGMGRVIQEGR